MGGSPVSEPLSYGTNTTCFNDHMNADNFSDNTSSSSSHSLSNNNPYNYRHSSNSTLPKRKISIDRNEEYLDTDGTWALLMKLIHPMKASRKMHHYLYRKVHQLITKKRN